MIFLPFAPESFFVAFGPLDRVETGLVPMFKGRLDSRENVRIKDLIGRDEVLP